MGSSEKLTPRRISPESEWYNFTSDPTSKIQFWENELSKDRWFEKVYATMWRHYDEYDREDIRRRTKALMKIMILRACGYVVSDFKDFENRFYRGIEAD